METEVKPTQKKAALAAMLLSGATLAFAAPVAAFCGFYVAQADAKLFNKASKVVVARKDQRTAVTMASDYQGDPKEFALVIPVPVVINKEQIKIVDNALVDHLDAYSAPRLVEYFDSDPCALGNWSLHRDRAYDSVPMAGSPAPQRAEALGVKVEAEYTVGEYDIVILSATQSDGLATWLGENGYKLPDGAAPVLGSYIKQDMKFFVAKVNLKEQGKLGFHFLRPIQVNYETNKFMLPIRLGTVNADGPQDMIVLMLTEKGRVETTNYRTVKLPSNIEIPLYVKPEFGKFYKAMFDNLVAKDDGKLVYLEYAWDMGWCDPCAADPIPNDKLVTLGAFWAGGEEDGVPPNLRRMGSNVFVTRLHVRYDAAHFPEDLMFQETADRANFQGRYILRHPYTGPAQCVEGNAYHRSLGLRFEQEATTLAHVTGWDIATIREQMSKNGEKAE
jgi:hypothetical protein